MKKYNNYLLEDFVLDSAFQKWVRFNGREDEKFWTSFKASYPMQTDDVDRAYALLDSLYRRYTTAISDEEIDSEINKLVLRIRREKNADETPAQEKGRNRSISPLFKKLAVAAMVVCAVGIGYHYTRPHVQRNTSYQLFTKGKSLKVYTNTLDKKQMYILDDGSSVVLDPGATLNLPVNFPEASREVFLTGTAAFNVQKDAERPFTVYSDKLVTQVLGTRFIVRAPSNGQAVVEVREGKVSVFKSSDFSKPEKEKMGLILTSNQKIVLNKLEDRLLKELSDTPEIIVTPPPTVTFNYVNAPVSQVLLELMAAYHVDIIFDEELLKDCPLTATLSDQTLLEKLSIVCEAIEAKYELIDGQIMIYAKGCS